MIVHTNHRRKNPPPTCYRGCHKRGHWLRAFRIKDKPNQRDTIQAFRRAMRQKLAWMCAWH